jgi:hypothetical protein
MERRHRYQNPAKILRYLKRVAPFEPMRLVDIDEMKMAPSHFQSHFGYSPEGDAAVREQIVIGTRSFVVIAAMGYFGMICWKVYEENTGHTHVEDFLSNTLAPMLLPDAIGLIDNASSHHMPDVQDALDHCFNGHWYFSSAYSPHLKPIEKGFALVKNFLRTHEDEALRDPVKWINDAFELYSVRGALGHVCQGFFRPYVHLHEHFLAGRF